MKITVIAATLLSLSSLAATPAGAQTVRPGLWEMQSSLGKGYGKSLAGVVANNKKMMADMPAEARKELEAIEAENAGQVRYTDDHVITKSCLTKEQAARVDRMWTGKGNNCKEQHSPLVGGVMKISFSCTNPASTGSGTLRFRGDTGFDMEMSATTTMKGQPFVTKATASGKWLGANCGKIAPDTDED